MINVNLALFFIVLTCFIGFFIAVFIAFGKEKYARRSKY